MDSGEWLTIAEAAAVLKLNGETVRRWLNSGRLKGVLLGGKAGWRVSAAEIARVLNGGGAGGQGGGDGR